MHPSFDIRPGLHLCRFDSDYVCLDLPADRYFLVAGDTAQALAGFLGGYADRGQRALLLEQNIISPACRSRTTSLAMPPIATASLIDQPLPQAPLPDALRAIFYQRQARTDLRRHSVGEMLGLFREPAQERPANKNHQLCVDVAAAFQRARRYVAATDQCLARGIGMRRMLARRGCDARLVLGVTMPFAAHCWVQVGETVLTDPIDVVLHYKPIFAA